MDKFEEYPDDTDIKEGRGWLPAWWMYLLFSSIVFSIGYVLYYHVARSWTQEKEYAAEVEAHKRLSASILPATLTADGRNPLAGNPEAIASGMRHFQSICAACHKPDGTGLIGPNLVDAQFLHGKSDQEIYAVIMEGVVADFKQVPPKGPMPAHKTSLGGTKVLQIMAFLASKNSAMEQARP
ncbi:MAG: c-type cytochrome [Spirochaetales bacterium]|nr:c-type cytochrome [Spirochaetales bacterium]